jgi:poly(A) polymerase
MKHALLLVIAIMLAPMSCAAADSSTAFDVSYAAGRTDPSGQPLGGTEIRNLVAHGGKLFAANGYWMETPRGPWTPGPQILVLDGAGKPWRVDHEFDERVANGRRRHIAISALAYVTFRTDQRGAALASPVSMLLASTWDVTARRLVFARDDRTGAWEGAFIAQGTPAPNFLPQIRSFGFHRDRRSGVDHVFAGDTDGIFSGVFDPGVPGGINWSATPELATAGLGADAFPGLSRGLRISSFAEAQGRLLAAIGQQIWVREDGAVPRWRKIYTNPDPHFSETGLRGLTAVSEAGTGEFLLAAVEGIKSRIVRIDPTTGAETTDLDLDDLLDRSWGTRVSYAIAAYNDMAKAAHTPAGDDLLIGIEAYIPAKSPRPPGHVVLDLNRGVEGGAWFLVRHPGGHYELHQVTARFPVMGQNLVSARTFAPSPFPEENGAFYVGGYDCNEVPAHDTAWIARFFPYQLSK